MRENVISQRATSSPSALLRAGGAAAMLALALVGGCVVYPAGRVARFGWRGLCGCGTARPVV